MKKLLLMISLIAFSNMLFAQAIDEDFEGVTPPDLPTNWSVIDNGDALLGTWVTTDSGFPHAGDICLYVDCYDSDASGGADDYIITPQISVSDGDFLTFWAASKSSSYPDGFKVLVSTTGTAAEDFTIELDNIAEASYAYALYSYELTKNANISDGDNIYIAIYCNTNGSGLYVDDFRVGQYVPPMFNKAYTVNDTTLHIYYDQDLVADSLDVAEFEMMGSGSVAFDAFEVSSDNSKMLMLYSTTSIANDNILDTLVYKENEDTLIFYAGFMPIEYTTLTNPNGTMEEGYYASFTGFVTATNKNGRVWIADGTGAYNGTNSGDGDFGAETGDSILFYGKFSPYKNQSEIYPADFIKDGGEPTNQIGYENIAASNIDTAIAADTDPAEKYEGTLVTISNVTIDSWDATYEYFYATSGTDVIRIGDIFGIFDGTYNEGLLSIGTTYTISGIVAGKYGEYQVSPRDLTDIDPVDDAANPTVTNDAQSVSNAFGNTVTAQSDEPGKIYIILDGETQATEADFQTAVDAFKGACTEVFANTAATIDVSDLAAGTYYAYAVDLAGNISSKGTNAITITSGAMSMPYTEDFESTALIPDEMILINNDGGTPATSLATYANLADSAFIVRHNEDFGDNIALGTSWYDESVDADDWLILPKIHLNENAKLTWDAMSLTTSGTYKDSYEIYVSTTSATVDEFLKNNPVYSVTDEEASENADTPGNGVQTHGVNLADKGFTDVDAYIAIRLMTPYPGGDRLGIDNIILSTADDTAPTVSNDAQTVTVGDDVYVQSNEPTGKVYIILDGEPQTTIAQLEDAVASSVGASADVTAADTDITISTTGLVVGTYYAYAVDSAQNMSDKGTNAITIEDESTDVEELLNELVISPNPAKSVIKIDNMQDIDKVTIMNVIGQEMKSLNVKGEKTVRIDISEFHSGMYIVSFHNKDGVIKSSKIIKQ